MSIDRFFEYAKERYRIKLRRDRSETMPWTDDPILQTFRFCNVFREDDVVTQWVKTNVRERYADDPHLLLALVISRWINRVSTLERLLDDDLLVEWNPALFYDRLKDCKPLVTGAYMIKTPAGMNKLNGLIWCLNHIAPDAFHLQARVERGESLLEGLHEVLCSYPYLGRFMAYEMVTDLRHTHLFDQAPDIMTWASFGPGAARGLTRVYGKGFNYNRPADQTAMLEHSAEILRIANRDSYSWPISWPRWEMREVEHTLCEFDKYERARLCEGRPKQRYVPA